jgi:hypothetical protein
MKFAYYSAFANTGNPSSDISTSVPFMQNKYQIISPGFSGVNASSPSAAYGVGGLYDSKNATNLTATPDGDNITNFNPGTLSGE